jgi:hypothetical protein
MRENKESRVSNRLEFRLTRDDLLAFSLYYVRHSRVNRRVSRRLRIVGPIIFFLFAVLLYPNWIPCTIYTLFGVLWFLLYPVAARIRVRRHYAKVLEETAGDFLHDPFVLELRDDAIYSSAHLGESKTWYSGIEQVVENNGYTYILMGKRTAFILPHDRIPKPALDSFLATLREKMKKAEEPS